MQELFGCDDRFFRKGSQHYKNTVLFVHHCRKFDSIILYNAITKCNYCRLSENNFYSFATHNLRSGSTYLPVLPVIILRNFCVNIRCTWCWCKYLPKLVEHRSIFVDAYYFNCNFSTSYIMSIIKQTENKKKSICLWLQAELYRIVSWKKISSSRLFMHNLLLAYQRK